MTLKSETELGILHECGRRLSSVLKAVAGAVRPGISTFELDQMAERLVLSCGGSPVFKGYRARPRDLPFPASICTSVNDEVVHAIPRPDRILRSGDIVSLDIGMRWPSSIKASLGLITDMAVTVAVGKISAQSEKILGVTQQALEAGIAALKPEIYLGDLGYAIQSYIEAHGFGVIRELVGHGVGRKLHEAPNIPNYGIPGQGQRVKEGMVLAVEPMATVGRPDIKLDRDGWTWRTVDGSLAAHFEHTVVVTKTGVEILTKL